MYNCQTVFNIVKYDAFQIKRMIIKITLMKMNLSNSFCWYSLRIYDHLGTELLVILKSFLHNSVIYWLWQIKASKLVFHFAGHISLDLQSRQLVRHDESHRVVDNCVSHNFRHIVHQRQWRSQVTHHPDTWGWRWDNNVHKTKYFWFFCLKKYQSSERKLRN